MTAWYWGLWWESHAALWPALRAWWPQADVLPSALHKIFTLTIPYVYLEKIWWVFHEKSRKVDHFISWWRLISFTAHCWSRYNAILGEKMFILDHTLYHLTYIVFQWVLPGILGGQYFWEIQKFWTNTRCPYSKRKLTQHTGRDKKVVIFHYFCH